MYSKERFFSVKCTLVDALLTLPDYHVSLQDSIEAEFLENLLADLATYGEITQKNVEAAIDSVWDAIECVPEDDRDDLIADLLQIGEYYIGRLSDRQQRELSRLCDLCADYLDDPRPEVLQEIEEML